MPTLLMCPPTHFRIAYEINPWMDLRRDVDRPLAQRQWEALYEALTLQAGARVRLVEPAPDQPDMVFTANAGLVVGRRFLPSNFRHAERAGEEARFCDWMAAADYTLAPLPEGGAFEGEGDALFCGDLLLAGYGFRTDLAAHRAVEQILGWPVLSLELVDPRFYHLDTCLLPLGPGATACYLPAFSAAARRALREKLPSLIAVEEAEALRLGCNAVVLGRSVVLPAGCPRLSAALAERGYRPIPVYLSEFLKAGGSAKCLVLYLDLPEDPCPAVPPALRAADAASGQPATGGLAM